MIDFIGHDNHKSKSSRIGLVFNVSASHTVGCGFVSLPGHIKDHHQNGTNCPPAMHICVWVGV